MGSDVAEMPVPKITYRAQIASDRMLCDAVCPICGAELEIGISHGHFGRLAQTVARRNDAFLITCDRHSLADIHHVLHPFLPQRGRRQRRVL